MSISISRQIIADMLQQAEQAYPAECCGFILGQAGGEQADGHYYIGCQNTRQENRERRFLIDPQIYQDVEDRADQEGRAIVSIVHSHPDHPDEPSEFDRRHAWPGVSYIIISVRNGKSNSYRSWRLSDDREHFIEEPISR